MGRWNWLLVPGGPGLGSESLLGLARAARLSGSIWLVDLPGDGSNRALPVVGADPYARWPDVLVEAAEALEGAVMVGHSTGGMLMLSVPELEAHLSGMALVSSAPHGGWRTIFAEYARAHPLPQVDRAAQRYAQHPSDESVRKLTLAAAPWNFSTPALAAGRALLEGLPYNHRAAAWADAHFDASYRARWVPRQIPTLILGGTDDMVVDQRLWREEPKFSARNILHRQIEGAGHFPWIEAPSAIQTAFTDLTVLLETISAPR